MIGKRTRFDFETDEPFWCAEEEKEKKKDDKHSSHQDEGKDKLVFCDYLPIKLCFTSVFFKTYLLNDF